MARFSTWSTMKEILVFLGAVIPLGLVSYEVLWKSEGSILTAVCLGWLLILVLGLMNAQGELSSLTKAGPLVAVMVGELFTVFVSLNLAKKLAPTGYESQPGSVQSILMPCLILGGSLIFYTILGGAMARRFSWSRDLPEMEDASSILKLVAISLVLGSIGGLRFGAVGLMGGPALALFILPQAGIYYLARRR